MDYDTRGDLTNIDKIYVDDKKLLADGFIPIRPGTRNGIPWRWRWGLETFKERIEEIEVRRNRNNELVVEFCQSGFNSPRDYQEFGSGTSELKSLFKEKDIFDNPKSVEFLNWIIQLSMDKSDIILDFFAGSGTTGHAVMQLNAEDGGNRKFILCQIDEPIKEDKPAYKFCIDNNLPPVISSITIERLKRAGEKIEKEIEEANSKVGLFQEEKKPMSLCGFKVFDSVEAPKLKVDDKGQISITENETDALSRIYNMIFTVGLDEPTQVPEEVMKDCIYKIGNHYYITNSNKITSDDYSNAIKNGKVFIDGWTASLNGTLQNYKEDVKIVF